VLGLAGGFTDLDALLSSVAATLEERVQVRSGRTRLDLPENSTVPVLSVRPPIQDAEFTLVVWQVV
jgi:hypothetical protein